MIATSIIGHRYQNTAQTTFGFFLRVNKITSIPAHYDKPFIYIAYKVIDLGNIIQKQRAARVYPRRKETRITEQATNHFAFVRVPSHNQENTQ